jgi:histidyl-tRNA synthetase
MDLSQPRGIRDIEPQEYELHQRIRNAFDEISRVYNFRPMEPGPIETLAVLRAKSGSAVDEQIYAFKDKGGRDVGLRFDLTVGMTRYVAGRRELKPPVKLASYGGVWRYDEPQHARYRWFHQWDVEVFGDPTVDADAEVMDMTYNLFRRLGLGDITVQIGDRRVVEEYIRKVLKVDSEERAVELMRALDKVTKKSEEELVSEYEQKGFSRETLMDLIEFGRVRGTPEQVTARLDELKLESARDLSTLKDSLKHRGVGGLEYNLSIVRGIDYYTAIVFEIVDKARGDLGSLCGGGRYDVLPKIFGRPELAATGAAGGVERIAMSLGEAGRRDDPVYVAFTEEELISNALRILSSLREAGVRTELGQRGRNLRKQLQDASDGRFRWTVIVGRREAASGMVVLKDMIERTEQQLSPEEALKRIVSPAP